MKNKIPVDAKTFSLELLEKGYSVQWTYLKKEVCVTYETTGKKGCARYTFNPPNPNSSETLGKGEKIETITGKCGMIAFSCGWRKGKHCTKLGSCADKIAFSPPNPDSKGKGD